jgi:diguanylate cyclase (GGDEF)-like protein
MIADILPFILRGLSMNVSENVSDFVFGPQGSVFSYTIILTILVMMLLISLRLLFSRRKKAYLSMTMSVVIIIVQHILLIRSSFTDPGAGISDYSLLLLKLISFLLLNMGVFQLYNATRVRHKLLFYLLLLVSLGVSSTYFLTPVWVNATGSQLLLLQRLGMELYLFVLIFLSFALVAPVIGQTRKYQAGLTIYFCAHTVHMINSYLFSEMYPVYTTLENMLLIAYFLIMFFLLFERIIELMQAIYTSSITDGLTRLYNRKYFDKRVANYVHRHIPVSVIFSDIDIDNFKKLNDTKGHDVGDKVLKHVAKIIREEAEEYGICGRYGGEEMVVLLTDGDIDAGELAERIRSRVEAETIATVSMGYSTYKRGMSADDLIKQADQAMYSAKQTGKNKVVKYAKNMPKAAP